ncbi:MAG: MarR family transcriptional regulator [Methylocystis sp.]
MTNEELADLAEFREALRNFLAFGEQVAATQGATTQWYQALLVIKTFDSKEPITVGALAKKLMIRDHSATELVSRLVRAKLVQRKSDPADGRRSYLHITPRGERVLSTLALAHLERLREFRKAFLKPFKVEK